VSSVGYIPGEIYLTAPGKDIMKKMKILYFAHLQDEIMDFLEDNVKEALEELEHEVIVIDEYNFKIEELLSYVGKVDLLLFHRGGIYSDNEQNFFMSLTQLNMILDNFKCKKVCWYTDKIWSFAHAFIKEILPKVDLIFVNDDTWLRSFETKKVFPLHCAAGKKRKGRKKKELESDLAFIGRIYGFRKDFVSEMKKRFGRKFKYYDNIWKKDFDNLCQSVKAIVLPRYPFDDFFWSDAIYKILSSGGFLIFPRLYGIQKEGFIEGSHYVAYSSSKELIDAIKYWTDPKNEKNRKIIAKQGQDFVLKNINYKDKVKYILNKLKKCDTDAQAQ
jgi:hypothetical protein